ncbi:hypothetical protein SDC9_157701 [bioreactor metagenome]|uniref:Uncharacterized protein n=1 Tax=bioreactor metagenome TaxID=1076179 RepID=A0A645F9V7_9ZZZZ
MVAAIQGCPQEFREMKEHFACILRFAHIDGKPYGAEGVVDEMRMYLGSKEIELSQSFGFFCLCDGC